MEAFCNRNTPFYLLEFFKFLLRKFGDDQNSTFLLPFFFNNEVSISRFYCVEMQHNYCQKGCNQRQTEHIETYKNIGVTKVC